MENYSRVYAGIDLDAVRHNFEGIRRLLKPETKIIAVVKTDGYGHGAARIAQEIEPYGALYGFAVATAEEAEELRSAGIKKPILILGYVFPEHYDTLVKIQAMPAVFTLEMARQLASAAAEAGRKLPVHIKIDTGMSRIGLPVSEKSADIIAQIASLPHMMVEGVFTHFARADEADKTSAEMQLEQFQDMTRMIKERGVEIPYRHCCNSAGIIDLPQAQMELVRAGIILYGLWPSDEVCKERIDLKPVLSLKSHIAHVKELEAGRSVSYGGTYTLREKETIATIPVGYGDGYPRSLSNRGYVLVHGKKAPIRGRVCMDQFMVDVTGIDGVKTGDEVTLAGKDGGAQITLEELGAMSGRFNYEFACALGKRIPRVFFKNGVRLE